MSFEEVLTFLLSLVGEPVEVAVESPASGLVAHFRGRLAHGHELSGVPEPDTPLFFSFDDAETGFFVAPLEFHAARRSADGASVRIEDRAGVVIHVEHARDAGAA